MVLNIITFGTYFSMMMNNLKITKLHHIIGARTDRELSRRSSTTFWYLDMHSFDYNIYSHWMNASVFETMIVISLAAVYCITCYIIAMISFVKPLWCYTVTSIATRLVRRTCAVAYFQLFGEGLKIFLKNKWFYNIIKNTYKLWIDNYITNSIIVINKNKLSHLQLHTNDLPLYFQNKSFETFEPIFFFCREIEIRDPLQIRQCTYVNCHIIHGC
jgi:hypothetical protein